MKAHWNRGWYRQAYIGAHAGVDDHAVDVSLDLLPFFSVGVEAYYRKNYWVGRGIYVSLQLLGLEVGPERIPEGERPHGAPCAQCGGYVRDFDKLLPGVRVAKGGSECVTTERPTTRRT